MGEDFQPSDTHKSLVSPDGEALMTAAMESCVLEIYQQINSYPHEYNHYHE